MTRRLLLLLPALLFSSCDPPFCQRWCNNGGRDQLIRDFAVLPQAVQCDEEKWLTPRNCAECEAMLSRDYGVVFSDCRDGDFIQPSTHWP